MGEVIYIIPYMENKINIKLVIHRLSTVFLLTIFLLCTFIFLFPKIVKADINTLFNSYISGNAWYIGDIGNPVNCPSGSPNKWESYINDILTYTADPFNCTTPPWVANITTEGLTDGDVYKYIFYNNTEALGYIALTYENGEYVPFYNIYTTRVDNTYPNNGQTIATSSSPTIFTFDGYINTDDWNSSSQYSWVVSKSRKCANPLSGCTEYLPQDELFRVRESINSSGDIDESYIKQITELGEYFMFIDYTKGTYCVLGFCLGDEIVYSTSTTFTVSTTTNRDLLRKKAEKNIQDMGKEADDNTFSKCRITDFDLLACSFTVVDYLFIPNNGSKLIMELKEGALSHPPIGYITRFVSVLNSTTTTPLPSLSYTFSTSSSSALSPILGGQKLEFSPFDYMYASGTPLTEIKSDGANGLPEKDVWDIFSPIISIIVYGTLLFIIVNDLMKLYPHTDRNLN